MSEIESSTSPAEPDEGDRKTESSRDRNGLNHSDVIRLVQTCVEGAKLVWEIVNRF